MKHLAFVCSFLRYKSSLTFFCVLGFLGFSSFALPVWADTFPLFSDYPVSDIFEGKPAEPVLSEPWAQHYETQIRRFVKEHKPNFAGHYDVIVWGCGSGCGMMVIDDVVTGKIYPQPLPLSGHNKYRLITLPNYGSGFATTSYHVDSRLFVIKTCPVGWGDTETYSGTSYFDMKDDGFHLIKRIPCDPSEQ